MERNRALVQTVAADEAEKEKPRAKVAALEAAQSASHPPVKRPPPETPDDQPKRTRTVFDFSRTKLPEPYHEVSTSFW